MVMDPGLFRRGFFNRQQAYLRCNSHILLLNEDLVPTVGSRQIVVIKG